MSPILGIWASAQQAYAGVFDSIATTTVGAGGAANVEFTSISGTYKHLQIRYIARGTDSANNNIIYQLNNDTGNNYSSHVLYGDGSSAVASSELVSSGITFLSNSNSSRLANSFASGIIDILDYSNTNKNKTSRALTGREDNTNGIVLFASGNWRNTAAITSIKIAPVVGNFAQYSTFALYGIK